jgi:hypothetical protein
MIVGTVPYLHNIASEPASGCSFDMQAKNWAARASYESVRLCVNTVCVCMHICVRAVPKQVADHVDVRVPSMFHARDFTAASKQSARSANS